MGIRSLLRGVVPSLLVLAACGGGKQKKVAAKPDLKPAVDKKPAQPAETEADRERKRHDTAAALIPPGTCLPVALKDPGAPRLELAAVNGDAVLCALDTDKSRLLGSVACWKVDLKAHTLATQDAIPLPGRGIDVLLDDHCARGFCLPKDAKLPADRMAHMAWNFDSTKVAVLTGDDVHMFDGGTKDHVSMFSIRGDKGVTNDPFALHFVGDVVLVEGSDAAAGGVWVFKPDGTQVGPITPLGAKETDKPVSTHGGSFSILDKNRVALSEQGFSQMTVYEVDTGKRTKAVRKALKTPCKPNEIDTFWKGGDKVTDKCRDALEKEVTPWIGADAIAGKSNLLVVMRGERVGELAVVDPKTLIEDKAKLIKLPWCEAAGGSPAAAPAAVP